MAFSQTLFYIYLTMRLMLLAVFAAIALFTCSPAVRFGGPEGGLSYQGSGVPDYVVIPTEAILASVRKFQGTAYKWGGTTAKGFDCSGLTAAVFKDCARIELPHSSAEQSRYGVEMPVKQLKCGDLLFFRMEGGGIDHVGIYLGDGTFVHASVSEGVTISRFDEEVYQKRFAFAKRLYYE